MRHTIVRALIASALLAVAAAPAAVAQRAITEASQTITVTKGSSALIVNPGPFERYAVGEPDVAQAVVVSPTEILLNGKAVGSTTLILWDKAGQPRLYAIEVAPDVAALQRFLRDMLPRETITVQSNGKAIVLSGQVNDPTSVSRAVEAAQSAGTSVIDNLITPPAVQVLLRVRFAEVNRTALKDFAFSFAGRNVEDISSPITYQGEIVSDGIVRFLLGERTGNFFESQIQAAITRGNLKSLAEPNLLTLPGKEATFLAGGEFPYPTVQGGVAGGNGANVPVSIAFKEFGIKLKFTPTITRSGTIRLKVAPEVSTLDFANGVTISGFEVPSLLTRRAEAEVEMGEGQYLALAGLLDNRTLESVTKIPILGDIPVIGELFKSRQKRDNQTELLVILTPVLVRGQDLQPSIPTGEPGEWNWSGRIKQDMRESPLRKPDGSWRDNLPTKCPVPDPANPACGAAAPAPAPR